MTISTKQGIRTRFLQQTTTNRTETPKRCVGVAKVVGPDSEAQVSSLAFVAGEDSGATDDMLFWVYTDASESIDIVRSFINVERFDISLNGRSPSSSISFSTSESSLGLSSSIVPSPSRTCGNGCGECGLDFAESVLERRESPLLERVESTRGLLFESRLGRDSGTGGVGAAQIPR
jgi:hypothetical protein